MQILLKCVCDVIFAPSGSSFFVHSFFVHKVKLVCVDLNEGYLRAANRGSKYLHRFLMEM